MNIKKLDYWLVENDLTYNEEAITSGVLNDIMNGSIPLSSVVNASGLNLSNPATSQANKIKAFFEGMDGVAVSFDYNASTESVAPDVIEAGYEGGPLVSIYVTKDKTFENGLSQVELLNRVIKHKYDFGGITLTVIIFDAVGAYPSPMSIRQSFAINTPVFDMIRMALDGNPNVVEFFSIYVAIFNMYYNFLELSPRILYYQNDDISNHTGFVAVLPVDLFREIFDGETLIANPDFNQDEAESEENKRLIWIPTMSTLFSSTHVPKFKK